VLGKKKEAKAAYYKALSLNPNVDLAINNLVHLGVPHRDLFKNFFLTIKNGVGANTQYYLVNAITAAIASGAQLPTNWIDMAEDRMRQFDHEDPFGDEKKRLVHAMFQWYYVREGADKAKEVAVAAGFKPNMFWRYKWPRTGWVPNLNTDPVLPPEGAWTS
jgi:hypothetical protein